MGEKDRRTSRMNMRLTPDDLALLKTGAHTQQQDLTTFVLEAALERLEVEPPIEAGEDGDE